jgi:glycosyltransferase involved in cell wall biosynthesis
MNILQIANKAIYPPDGGSIAILSIAKAYVNNGHKVHLLNMITHKHHNNTKIIEPEFRDNLTISGIKINTKISFIKLIANFLFSSKPFISERFLSKKFENSLINLFENNLFDFVQIEGLYSLQYIKCIKQNYKGKVLYRPHNVEYLIWERNAFEAKSILKKIYFKSLSKRIKKLEEKYLNSYDYLIPISNADAEIFNKLGNQKPFKVSPFGIDFNIIINQSGADKPDSEQSINYIGALDWIPNQKGLKWFIDYCFPIVLESFPEIKLNIAGRNAPDWFIKKLNQNNNIRYVGEVNNAYEYLHTPGPVIVPLFSGSGMRVKIIESMAIKKAIVSTSIAAEGINCMHNENILIADNPEYFANSVISLLKNRDLQKEIGENASKFVKENFDFNIIANNILNFIKD